MNATTNHTHDDDDMPAEIDFSKGVRGKFYHANAKLNLPVYLDQEVQAYRIFQLSPPKKVFNCLTWRKTS